MKTTNSSRRLLIIYGSQTGTSQDLAEHIWRESRRYNFTGPVLAMDDYNVRNLIDERLVVFVCSTTGQGEEPDNMKTFWKFLLRKSLPPDSLSGMCFGVLGLGDSSYAKFNFVAKRLNKRLQQLSARNLLSPGLCDDQHDLGPSAVYLNWIQDLWTVLNKICPNPQARSTEEDGHHRPDWQFRWDVKSSNAESIGDNTLLKWPLKEKSFSMTLLKNERTTDVSHFQDVRLLSFQMDEEVSWEPGDVVMVQPSNSDEKVKRLFELFAEHNLEFNADTVVEFASIHQVTDQL